MSRSTRLPTPSAALRVLFGAPSWLYRWRLGWLAGHRFLLLTYRGRRTGRTFRTVLEVIRYDPATHESTVMSGYGPTAGWYLSLRSAPGLRIQTGRLDYAPHQRFLEPDEIRKAAESFCRDDPLEARLMPRVLARMGAPGIDGSERPSEAMASLPMVAFRPNPDGSAGRY
jgi:deazaflavin-dependent oxidoreductase (nitroreductase family)